MYAIEAYKEYVSAQKLADWIWQEEGDTSRAAMAQQKANDAYELYEYAAGIKSIED